MRSLTDITNKKTTQPQTNKKDNSTESDDSENSGDDEVKKKGSRKKKIVWSREEDQKLILLVENHGTSSWVFISKQLHGRTGKQCRERWYNKLDPSIKKGNWNPEEDRILFQLHKELGNKWALISKRLHGRPSNAIKNRWHSHLKRKFNIDESENIEFQQPKRLKANSTDIYPINFGSHSYPIVPNGSASVSLHGSGGVPETINFDPLLSVSPKTAGIFTNLHEPRRIHFTMQQGVISNDVVISKSEYKSSVIAPSNFYPNVNNNTNIEVKLPQSEASIDNNKERLRGNNSLYDEQMSNREKESLVYYPIEPLCGSSVSKTIPPNQPNTYKSVRELNVNKTDDFLSLGTSSFLSDDTENLNGSMFEQNKQAMYPYYTIQSSVNLMQGNATKFPNMLPSSTVPILNQYCSPNEEMNSNQIVEDIYQYNSMTQSHSNGMYLSLGQADGSSIEMTGMDKLRRRIKINVVPKGSVMRTPALKSVENSPKNNAQLPISSPLPSTPANTTKTTPKMPSRRSARLRQQKKSPPQSPISKPLPTPKVTPPKYNPIQQQTSYDSDLFSIDSNDSCGSIQSTPQSPSPNSIHYDIDTGQNSPSMLSGDTSLYFMPSDSQELDQSLVRKKLDLSCTEALSDEDQYPVSNFNLLESFSLESNNWDGWGESGSVSPF